MKGFLKFKDLFTVLTIITCIMMIITINTNMDPYDDISLMRDLFNETA
jgi:hypothetical protein